MIIILKYQNNNYILLPFRNYFFFKLKLIKLKLIYDEKKNIKYYKKY